MMREGPLCREAAYYNDDVHFSAALCRMLELKNEVLLALAKLPACEHKIDLGSWSLRSAERVQMLCLWLQSNPAAETLDLSRCELPLRGGGAIGAALRENATLQHLVLGPNVRLPVQELSGKTPVRALNLARRKYGALAGCVLSELVAFNSVIETLDLSANMLGQRSDAGCIALGDALKVHPSRLHTLKLANNYIGDVGALALIDALAHNSTLQTIDLSGNEIGSAAAIELCTRLLGRTNSIRRLCLSGNGIDAAAAASQLKHKLGLTGLILEL